MVCDRAASGNLFFALPAPAHLAQVFESAGSAWDPVDRQAWRWVAPHLYHLTLVFLGSRSESQMAAIHTAGARAAAACAPLVLQAQGLGAFPSSSRPTVLWVGLRPSPELGALVGHLERALREEGVSFEGKSFKPHVTLARRRRDRQRSAPPLGEGWLGKIWGEWPVEELVLLQSDLGGGAPVYQKRGVWRLS